MKKNTFIGKSKVVKGRYTVKNVKPKATSIAHFTKAELKTLGLEIRRVLKV